MICGFNLIGVGDERSYSHVESRLGDNLADIALSSSLLGLENVKKYNFRDLTNGSIVLLVLICHYVLFAELNLVTIRSIIPVMIILISTVKA